MKLPIVFQSLDRIVGKEGRSKLLHTDSELYQLLKSVKATINQQFTTKGDRMDLHIEITKERRDPNFRTKAEQLHNQTVDVMNADNWGFLGRAFVLWTPESEGYGKTHITIAFFGNHPRPQVAVLQAISLDVVKKVV